MISKDTQKTLAVAGTILVLFIIGDWLRTTGNAPSFARPHTTEEAINEIVSEVETERDRLFRLAREAGQSLTGVR